MNLTQSSTSLQTTHKQNEKQQQLLDFELKQMMLYGPALGIYALPHLDQPTTWNAVVIVRHGCFKGAKFKMEINLQAFPRLPPSIFFLNKPYHPLIDQQTGQLDISLILASPWDQNNPANLYHLFNSLESIFADSGILRYSGSMNPKAGIMFQENQRQFMIKALESVQESSDSLGRAEEGWSLYFGKAQELEIHKLKEQMWRLSNSSGSIQEKIKHLMAYIVNDSNVV